MRTKRVLLATTALALLAGAQEAQAGGLYVSVFGGANWVTDSDGNFTTTDFPSTTTFGRFETDADTGFVLGGAIGTHLDKWAKGLKVELEASYRRNDVDGGWTVSEVTPGDTFIDAGPITANLSTFALLANIWYEWDMGWKVRPYVGGGAGWGRAHLDGTVFGDGGEGTLGTFDRNDDGFAWQLGAGFNYQAMPGVDVGIGYRYFDGPDFAFALDAFFGGKSINDKIENDSHAVMVNLTVDIN